MYNIRCSVGISTAHGFLLTIAKSPFMTNQNTHHLKLFYEKGDKVALGKFFSDNFDLIYRVSYHYTKNKADAEDICQQVMVRVMDTNSKCEAVYEESDKAVLGWLSILTANQARMFLRKNKRNLIRDNKKGAEMEKEKPNNLREKNSANNEDALEYALAKIPAQYKSAILLKYYDDLSYTEIAETLGLREVTIRSYISRGIEQMRLLLNKKATTSISTVMLVSMIANRNVSASVEIQKTSLIERTINSSRSQQISIINRRQSKNISVFKTFTAVAFVSVATLVAFKSFENEKAQETNIVNTVETAKVLPFSKSWDFSKDNADDIKVLRGSWHLDRKEGLIAPPDGKEITVELPFGFLNYYRFEADVYFYDYLIPNDGRKYMFQPSAENGMTALLSNEGFTILDDDFFAKKTSPHKDRVYYSFKTVFYYFDEFLIVSVNPEKPFLAKTKGFDNNTFRLFIKNLEITKMKYQPMGHEDTKTIKAVLKGLKNNMKDKAAYSEVETKLLTFLDKQPQK